MAKKSGRGTQHSIHGGLSSSASPSVDGSMKKGTRSVDDDAVRSQTAVGDSMKSGSGGVLK